MKKLWVISVIGLLSILLFVKCGSNADLKEVKINGMAQGTYYAITYFDDQERNLQPEIDSFFKAFDRSASVYLASSIISKVNNNDPEVELDDTFITIFDAAQKVSERTAGAFDITTLPLTNAWGFGFTDPMKLDSATVDSLLQYVNYRNVSITNDRVNKSNPAIKVDFNAIAQGYSADLIGKILEKKGIENYLVDVGGEVIAKGRKTDKSSWKVGIEKPAQDGDETRNIDVIINLENKALATSGNYRRFFLKDGIKYSHTIDPSTGFPVSHTLLSASVLAADCMTADAFATAFMVMGVEKSKAFLASNPDLGAHFIYTNQEGKYETWTSEGLEKLISKQ